MQWFLFYMVIRMILVSVRGGLLTSCPLLSLSSKRWGHLLEMGSRSWDFHPHQAVVGLPSPHFEVNSGHKGNLDFHSHLAITMYPCNSPLSCQRKSNGKNQYKGAAPSTLAVCEGLAVCNEALLPHQWKLSRELEPLPQPAGAMKPLMDVNWDQESSPRLLPPSGSNKMVPPNLLLEKFQKKPAKIGLK